MSIVCAVCGELYWPTGRWREDVCQPCFTINFAASQELRLHEESVPLTPRQRAALELMHTATPRREDASDAL